MAFFLPLGGSRATGSPQAQAFVDSGVEAGLEVSGFYDPLLAKLVVHGVDREHARARMLRALGEYEIGGVETLIGFHRALLSEPCFVEEGTCHGIVESEELAEKKQLSHTTTIVSAFGRQASFARLPVELDGRRFDVRVLRRSHRTQRWLARADRRSGMGQSGGCRRCREPHVGHRLARPRR